MTELELEIEVGYRRQLISRPQTRTPHSRRVDHVATTTTIRRRALRTRNTSCPPHFPRFQLYSDMLYPMLRTRTFTGHVR